MGNQVFAGSCSGLFYSFDRDTGEIGWKYDTRRDGDAAQFHGNVIAIGDAIVFGSDTVTPAHTYSIDRKSGRVIWNQSTDAIQSDIFEADENLIGRSSTGDLVALSSSTGKLVWKVSGSGEECDRRIRSPTVADGIATFVDRDGKLIAASALDGSILWTVNVGCSAGAPIIWKKSVYVGLKKNEIVQVGLTDGSIQNRRKTRGLPHSRLTPIGDVLISTIGNDRLVAFSSDLSRILWEHQTEDELSSPQPVVWGNEVVIGDGLGNLMAFNSLDGARTWSTKVNGRIRGLSAEADVIYVGTFDGKLYAYRPADN